MNNNHDLAPGKHRLPKEITDQWDTKGYGTATKGQMYDVLWWIADHGYSIVPDSEIE